jgi:hypothetical protein
LQTGIEPAFMRWRCVRVAGGFVVQWSFSTERLDDCRVELAAGVACEFLECRVDADGWLVGPVGCHRVEGVADGDDARAEGDVIASGYAPP